MDLWKPHQKRPRRCRKKERGAFAGYVKAKRIAMGLTQKELAEMTGISYGFIQDIERGVLNLRLSKVMELIMALGGEVEIKDRVVDQAMPLEE